MNAKDYLNGINKEELINDLNRAQQGLESFNDDTLVEIRVMNKVAEIKKMMAEMYKSMKPKTE